jgi:acetylornithine/succinyldiaminopimelate/putrescine aminotransferase
LNAAGDNTLRFVPPLIIDESQIADVLKRLASVVGEYSETFGEVRA